MIFDDFLCDYKGALSEEFNRRQQRLTVGPVDQVALCDGAFCLSIFPTGGVVLLWLLGLIGRSSSVDGFGRDVLLLLGSFVMMIIIVVAVTLRMCRYLCCCACVC